MHRTITTVEQVGMPIEAFPQTQPNLTLIGASCQGFALLVQLDDSVYKLRRPDGGLRLAFHVLSHKTIYSRSNPLGACLHFFNVVTHNPRD